MGCIIHFYKKWKDAFGKTVLKVCKRCGEMLYWDTVDKKFGLGATKTGWFYCKSVKDFQEKIADLKQRIPKQIEKIKQRKVEALKDKSVQKEKRRLLVEELKKAELI